MPFKKLPLKVASITQPRQSYVPRATGFNQEHKSELLRKITPPWKATSRRKNVVIAGKKG